MINFYFLLFWHMSRQSSANTSKDVLIAEISIPLSLSVPLKAFEHYGLYIRVPLISQNVPEGLHNGFLGAILCQSHPKKISDFYLHFWPLAPHFGGAVGANGKTAQKWLKKYQIFKLAENPFKSWKSLKPNAIPIFLWDVGLIKVVSKFSFGHP